MKREGKRERDRRVCILLCSIHRDYKGTQSTNLFIEFRVPGRLSSSGLKGVGLGTKKEVLLSVVGPK